MRRGTLGPLALAAALLVPAVASGGEQYEFDSTPPKVTVGGSKIQEPEGKRVAKVRGSCNERCRIAATGEVVLGRNGLGLKRRFERLEAGEDWTVTMRLTGKKAARSLEEALEDGDKARADIRLRAEDAVGNPAKAYIRIKLKR